MRYEKIWTIVLLMGASIGLGYILMAIINGNYVTNFEMLNGLVAGFVLEMLLIMALIYHIVTGIQMLIHGAPTGKVVIAMVSPKNQISH
jgi:hypothetical protein